jgi:cytosine/adenosine deaminase-related metal-dependent hydrolase
MNQGRLPQRENILLRNGLIVTMNAQNEILRGDILIRHGSIAGIGKVEAQDCRVIDCSDLIVMPGFVQTHVHLCQTLFRGQADDLTLLDWLQQKIWPFEAAIDENAIGASARLGIAELIKSGTTCILDMGSIRHYDIVFEELECNGLRAAGGKCLMDHPETVPPGLLETTAESLAACEHLGKTWHGRDEGRLRFAVCPRFAISCTDALLSDASALARDHGYLLHTHASENRDEISLVEKRAGMGNIHFLHRFGFTGQDVALAHCIWLSGTEKQLMADTDTAIAHCPSSNLKLASGVAPVYDYLQRGIRVGLGADGAPCNNNLDMFVEMRLAALLQKPRYGTAAMKAQEIIQMATIGGAKVLNLDHEIGSLEIGKKADLIGVVNESIFSQPGHDIFGQLVYATSGRDVLLSVVAGRILMASRELQTIDEKATIAVAKSEIKKLLDRI